MNNHWSETGMARRLDWEKRQFDRKRKLSTADEAEFLESDMAANWIKRAEERLEKDRSDPNILATISRFKYDEIARLKQTEERGRRFKRKQKERRTTRVRGLKQVVTTNPELADIPGYLYSGKRPPWE